MSNDIIKPLKPATFRAVQKVPAPSPGLVQPQGSISGSPRPNIDPHQGRMKFNSPQELSGTSDPTATINEPRK
jgi:hypothetical protein